ncbi:hypothetical protein V6N11_001270 [Hibiscus sabdariffa]|uniref:Transport inhibitor response 1 domain-containing protein n=1 Tax=Hibiscus sabdariffa TaxID=183260 RepID=A0ABR2S021_9ROSI
MGNCYSVSPRMVIRRFPKFRSIELKGKPHFTDFNPVPDRWGGYVFLWIAKMAGACPWLEEIKLKRMVVTDESLELIAKSFKNFKVLVLSSCERFSTNGPTAIATGCNQFSDTYASLVSLNISCLGSDEVSFSALERLVGRCTNPKTLRLNREVPLDKISNILRCAPQLVEFGTGFGIWSQLIFQLFYLVCSKLKSFNLSYATIQSPNLIKLLSQCPNLQRLLVLDYTEDSGLEALTSSCKDLQELRVFPSDPYGVHPNVSLTEHGLVTVSSGCPKLQSVMYFCRRMSNKALVTTSKNCPNFTCFRLCIIEPRTDDYLTLEPLDIGFGAIIQYCQDLQCLSLYGLLTDHVFEYIGTYVKKLEMLFVVFAGDSDLGLYHVLSGCESLRKLEIRDCPFGDKALLANATKLDTMRSL